MALTTDAALWQWGESIGDTAAPTTPRSVELPAGTSVAQVASGDDFAVVRTDTGQLLSWGDNSQGQLGDGSSTDNNTPQAVAPPGDSSVTELAVGRPHGLIEPRERPLGRAMELSASTDLDLDVSHIQCRQLPLQCEVS